MRCPECDARVDPQGRCTTGHDLRNADGVIVLMPSMEGERVARLEAAVSTWRREGGRAPLPPEALRLLPDGPVVADDPEWRLRRLDLELIRRLLVDRRGASVLDVGAWNGWLSARLAADGYRVTAVDAFAGPEALGAHRWSPTGGPGPPATWGAIQLDLDDLPALEESYDVVVVNRCLQFFAEPARAVAAARGLLARGGLLAVTGMAIHDASDRAARRVAAEAAAFKDRFGSELFLRPAKGYLDRADLRALEAAGLLTYPMPGLRAANLRARVDRSRPEWRYGTAGPTSGDTGPTSGDTA